MVLFFDTMPYQHPGGDNEGDKEEEFPDSKQVVTSKTSSCEQSALYDYALFCLAPDNAFRRSCATLMAHPKFDQVVMGCIIVNSISMAYERPSIEDGSTERLVLDVLGHIFSLIFTLEHF